MCEGGARLDVCRPMTEVFCGKVIIVIVFVLGDPPARLFSTATGPELLGGSQKK